MLLQFKAKHKYEQSNLITWKVSQWESCAVCSNSSVHVQGHFVSSQMGFLMLREKCLVHTLSFFTYIALRGPHYDSADISGNALYYCVFVIPKAYVLVKAASHRVYVSQSLFSKPEKSHCHGATGRC